MEGFDKNWTVRCGYVGLTVMNHTGLAESDWGTWREVDWNIRASDLDWNILGNDSFHGTYISNTSDNRVDITWT